MKVFFSYGHDEHADFIKKVKEDLIKKFNIDVWIDSTELRAKQDWEQELENAILNSDEIIYFITPYSARRPDGYCLNELAFALANGKDITPVMVDYITPPLSICRIQYMDIQHIIDSFDHNLYSDFLEKLNLVLKDKVQLSVEGDHFNTLNILKPIDFSQDIKKHLTNFVGREWLYESVNKLLSDESVKILWIKAKAGFGKTAFSSMLQHKHPHAVGIHYCQFNNNERKNVKSVLTTFIYQLSTQIPAYNELISELNFVDIINQNENVIFETFLLEPLNKITSKETYFFIIDALDEALDEGENKLADLIVQFMRLPKWLNIVITSRPEPYLELKFEQFSKLEIDTSSNENKEDLYLFLQQFENKPNGELLQKQQIKDTLVENSERNILYLQEIVKEILNGTIQEKDIQNIPQGMNGLYLNTFQKHFSHSDNYKQLQRSFFEVMIASNHQISLEFIEIILNWTDYKINDVLESIGSIIEIENNKLYFFHKSLADWLTDRKHSGKDFYVSQAQGHNAIAKYIIDKNYLIHKDFTFEEHLIVLYSLYFTINQFKENEIENLYLGALKIKETLYNLVSSSKSETTNISLLDLLKKYTSEDKKDIAVKLESYDFSISKYFFKYDPNNYTLIHIDSTKNYAKILFEVGNIQESITTYNYLIELLQSLYLKDISYKYEYAKMLNTLGYLYSFNNELENAIKILKTAQEIINTEDLSSDKWVDLYANNINNLAVCLGNIGEVVEEIKLEKEALHLIEERYLVDKEKWSEAYLKSLNNLAISLKDTGKYKEATNLELKAYHLVQELYENDSHWINDYTLALNNLANTYKNIGEIEKSIQLEEEAVKLTEKQYQQDQNYWVHIYLKSLLNLAISYKTTFKMDQAILLEEKAILISTKLFKEHNSRWLDVYTRSLASLAITLSMDNNFKDALPLEEQALKVREDAYSRNPKRWVDAYTLSVNNLAITYYYLNEQDKSRELLEKNLSIREELYEHTNARWADVYTQSLVNLSLFEMLHNNFSQNVYSTINETLTIKEKAYQEDKDLWKYSYSISLNTSAYYLLNTNNKKEAIEHLQKAFLLREELFNEHNYRWIDSYLITIILLGSAYLLQNDFVSYMKYHSLVSQICSENDIDLLNNKYKESLNKFINYEEIKLQSYNLFEDIKNTIELEFLVKQSPNRWSDAFK